MRKRSVLLLGTIVGLTMLIGACAPMRAANHYEAPAMEWYEDDGFIMDMAEAPMSPEERGVTSGVGETAKAVERMVLYNADMRIAVEDPEATMQSIMDIANNAGGFVVYSNLYKTYTASGSLPRASLTVRVPAGQLNSIMESIKAMTPVPRDDVLSENVSGQDVTAEYTDLGSRLRNLEAAENALVDLMEQAQDPQDVLDVFSELTYYRGEIEVVKGRMRYLEESAALSSLTVEIVPKESLQPITIAGWEPSGTAKRAVEALISTGQTLADGVIWFGIFCLPFLIPLGIGVYFLVGLFKKRRAKKLAEKPEKAGGDNPPENPVASP